MWATLTCSLRLCSVWSESPQALHLNLLLNSTREKGIETIFLPWLERLSQRLRVPTYNNACNRVL